MSDYLAGFVPTAPTLVSGGLRLSPVAGYVLPSGAAVTTYFYRTTTGTRGSTTDAAAIPAGAVVERVT